MYPWDGTGLLGYYVTPCIQTPWTPEHSLCESRTARRPTRYIVVVLYSSFRACWSISVEHSAVHLKNRNLTLTTFMRHLKSYLFSVLISYRARLRCDHINVLYKFTITYLLTYQLGAWGQSTAHVHLLFSQVNAVRPTKHSYSLASPLSLVVVVSVVCSLTKMWLIHELLRQSRFSYVRLESTARVQNKITSLSVYLYCRYDCI